MTASRDAMDASVPNPARVYDYLLGGKDNYAIDRDLCDRLLALDPAARHLAEVNRRFVLAATEWVASGGIRQFIDLGCGLPRTPALHDAVRQADPRARVVYADHDEVTMCHVVALQGGPGLAAVRADVTDPEGVLAVARGTRLLNQRQPACVVLGATLSEMTPDVAAKTVAGYMAALAPGSCAVISCASYQDEWLGGQVEAVMAAAGPWYSHSAEDIAGFFAGLQVEGGQARDVRPWCWPELQEQVQGVAVIGGIGQKP